MHKTPTSHAMQLRINLVFMILILASLACGQPASAPANLTLTAPTMVGAATVSVRQPTETGHPELPAATTAPTPTASPTTPPQPPVQVVDLLAENLEAGKWSEGQALVDILSVAAGKKSAQAVFGGQSVAMVELSGFQAMVKQYLETNPDAPEKQQLEDLLAVLAPSAERMLPYAQPESAANLGQTVAVTFKRPANRREDIDCQELFYSGFPTPKPGQPTPMCVVYKEFQVLGKTYRIFYPKDLPGSAATPTNMAWVQEALKTAAESYQALEGKVMPDTDVVYVVQGAPKLEEYKTYAAGSASIDENHDGRCQIVLYKGFGSVSEAFSKQLVAHEVFHCYHQTFMKTADSAKYVKAKWWEEGSAQYFSNLVYPNANSEYDFINSFDTRSLKESLLTMSYENAFFFQYLGNAVTPKQVLEVMRGFPASGEPAAYINALNTAIPNFETLFHEFGQTYLDVRIGDSGGGAIPFSPKPGETVNFTDGGTLPMETKPLTITRYNLAFLKGTYLLNKTSTGKGLDTWRPAGAVNVWEPMGKEVKASCGERAFIYLLTSVTPDATYLVKVEYGRDETGTQCDQCLLGKWRLDPITYNNYMDTALKAPAQNLNSTATVMLTFTGDSRMQADIQKISSLSAISQTDINGDAKPTTVSVQLEGEIVGDWSAQDGMLYLNTVPALEVSIKINGQDMGSDAVDANSMGGNFFYPTDAYVCTQDKLTFTPQIHGGNVAPLEFWRVK